MDCQATLSISVTQCDPTSATTPLHWPAPATVHVSCPAKQLAPQQRRDLAIQVLAGTETVSELARGVVELLRDVFDFRISLGTVHNIVHSPVAQARRINQQYDLSTIVIGLLDEIFQARDPVLVGVDAQSTFCLLLSPEEHRDADTWGVRLLELVDRGFAPQATRRF